MYITYVCNTVSIKQYTEKYIEKHTIAIVHTIQYTQQHNSIK